MKFFLEETVERLAGWRPVRRLASAIALDRAGRHLVELDHSDPARSQLRHLRGLIHRARNTAFGRSHDFARIRTYDDFKRLVPLSPAADYAGLDWSRQTTSRSATWPFNRAATTAIAHIMAARPREHLLNGPIVFLNEGTQALLAAVGDRGPAFRAYARGMVDDPLELLGLHLTCLVDSPSSVLQVLKEARRLTGREALRSIWPDLCAIVCIRSGSTVDSDLVRRAVDKTILTLEVWCDTAAPVAIEDPRHDALRLLTDHGIFWEFIPIETLTSEPERLSVGSIEMGGRYALAMSSPAGVWGCLLREQIVVESRTPVLIHVLESAPVTAPARPRLGQPARTSTPRPLALLKPEP